MPLSDHSVGVWLYDADTEAEVLIVGDGRDARVSSAVGENAATLILLTSRVPVRIVGKIRGFEGSVSGFLMNALGRTSAVDRLTFLDFVAHQTVSRRLKWGFNDLPVIIGNATCHETEENEEQYEISFDFWQTGEYEFSS